MSNGYPTIGILEQVREKMCTVETAEEIINHYIEQSCQKGYAEGVIDGRKEVLSKAVGLAQKGVNVPRRRDLTPLGMITFPEKKESIKSAFLSKVKREFDYLATMQEIKGIEKYGHELRPDDNYNWLDMALEELVDAVKYLVAEKEKRGKI